MKKFSFIAAICCMIIFAGCEGSSVTPKANISDCHPNLGELQPVKRMKAYILEDEVTPTEEEIEEEMLMDYSEILTVRCTGEKQMHIIRHDPHFTCCMTPQSSITRSGYTIKMNDWDIGVMPCNCECPRNIEATMNNLPYGTYTFSLRHSGKEVHSVDLDFVPELDTMIIWKAW